MFNDVAAFDNYFRPIAAAAGNYFESAAVEIVEADADDAGVRTGVVVASVAAEGIEVVAPAGCC